VCSGSAPTRPRGPRPPAVADVPVQEDERWPFARPLIGDTESFDLEPVHAVTIGAGVRPGITAFSHEYANSVI
jgi:hypothetical protein